MAITGMSRNSLSPFKRRKMKTVIRTLGAALALSCVFSGLSMAQQIPASVSANASSVSSQQLQQMLQQGGNEQVEEALRAHQSSSSEEGLLSLEETPDSLKKKKKGDEQDKKKQPKSIYEKIVRGTYLSPEKMRDSLEVFGASVFSNTRPLSSLQLSTVPVPADYTIGVGDEIQLTMWGRINEDHRLTVDRNGRINVPHIGPAAVAGMTFSSLQRTVRKKIENMKGVQASVTMGQLHSIYVYVMGQAKKPGRYTIGALSSLNDALFAAGGLTKDASLRNVAVKRNGRTVARIDLYDFLLSGESRENLRLMSGDVLFIPTVTTMAAITGNVMRSAIYEVSEDATVQDLIDLAGGLTPAAWTNRIQVERLVQNDYQIVLDITARTSVDTLDSFALDDGDVVKVFPIVEKDKNVVYLTGNVTRPGKYEFSPGMRINDILSSSSLLARNTFMEYALIKRYSENSQGKKLITFNVTDALHENAEENRRLAARDSIVIFNRSFFDPIRNVSIHGAVNDTGDKKLMENMTVRDLIIIAGGLREEASNVRGELYRKNYSGEQVITEKIEFCVECALRSDSAHNHILQKKDAVYIRTKKGWMPRRRITLAGEVNYPGEYVILEGESLGDIIRRAGGFTKEAYLEGAMFVRESVKRRQTEQKREYISTLRTQIASLSTQMASRGKTEEAQNILAQQQMLLSQLQQKAPDGRVVIDFTKERNYEDFTLKDKDSLYIPDPIKTVSIIGEVYNPRTFVQTPGQPVKDYVSRAGGFTSQAKKSNAYVIKANGTIVSSGMTNIMRYRLSGGDAIVVPKKVEYANRFKIFMQTLDSIYKFAATAGIIITAFN